MRAKQMILLAGAMIVLFAIVAGLAYNRAQRKVVASPSLSVWQIQQARNQELKDPKYREMYAVHQRFQDLFERMPSFDKADFGPKTRIAYWRSKKWAIQSVYDEPDGTQVVELGYAQGPGTDQEYIARLINGQYIGRANLDWNALIRDPHRNKSVVTANELPFVCRDVRSGSSQYAAIPSVEGGPNVTKTELADASMGKFTPGDRSTPFEKNGIPQKFAG